MRRLPSHRCEARDENWPGEVSLQCSSDGAVWPAAASQLAHTAHARSFWKGALPETELRKVARQVCTYNMCQGRDCMQYCAAAGAGSILEAQQLISLLLAPGRGRGLGGAAGCRHPQDRNRWHLVRLGSGHDLRTRTHPTALQGESGGGNRPAMTEFPNTCVRLPQPLPSFSCWT